MSDRPEIFCGVCGSESHTDQYHTKVKCGCGVINLTTREYLRSCWDCGAPLAMPPPNSGVKRGAEQDERSDPPHAKRVCH